jgi:pilus assembly protein CpaC
MKILKIMAYLFLFFTLSYSNELIQKNLNEKTFTINKGSFKILEFDKMIRNVKVNDKEIVEVDFVDNDIKPLQTLKIFAKTIGHGNVLVTFIDSSSMHIDISIVENLLDIINVAKHIAPNLDIQQTNGKIILKGFIDDPKTKVKILDLFKKGGIDIDKDLVDLINLTNPEKMIRLKLYAVEINNSKGLDLKNNWVVSSKNYTEVVNTDGLYHNESLNNFASTDAQRSKLVSDTIDKTMANAVTLTGGLTGAANYLGKYFNAALTLNYLSSKGVASILDETTLLTLENQDATFHAGGTIYLKIATTTNQGVPTTEVRNINYGLQLDIKAENIVNNNFVNLNINTKSTQIDWANTVDGIPSFTEKSIKTNVVVGNQSTIILGGLISSSSSQDVDKIPLLGDIPILGMLFTSKAFKEGKSELVFFITPEIVDPRNNDQFEKLDKKTNFTKELEVNKQELEEQQKQVIEENENVVEEKVVETNLDSKTEHEKRVKELLGY